MRPCKRETEIRRDRSVFKAMCRGGCWLALIPLLDLNQWHACARQALYHRAPSPTLGVLLLLIFFFLTMFHYISQAGLELANVVQDFSNSQYSVEYGRYRHAQWFRFFPKAVDTEGRWESEPCRFDGDEHNSCMTGLLSPVYTYACSQIFINRYDFPYREGKAH